MERKQLMDKLLAEDESPGAVQREKGMCQGCGHYTSLSAYFGKRLCPGCKKKKENEIKKDFF